MTHVNTVPAWMFVLSNLAVVCHSDNYLYHVQNYVNLVSSYNVDGYSTVDFPPLLNVSKAMVVKVKMHLYAINGFDEVAGNIELVGALEMSWRDETPIIHSITFRSGQRKEFLVPYDVIWTPKLVLTNAIGASGSIGDRSFLCRFDMKNYTVTWKPRVVISAACTPDVTYYPFDKQECQFVYTPWGFKYDEVNLVATDNEWIMDEYDLSGEWDIVSTSTEEGTKDGRSQVTFILSMLRKPLYFAFNILLPILVLCLLNATVFLLPAESGERVGFSVTCFLTFMVLLNMIMSIMPRSSSPISFLCYYLVVMMSNSGAMTLMTILLMRVYHKPEKDKVPQWMQRTVTFINCGCARLRCCVLCCRYLRNSCGCDDKRKCGCGQNERSISEETLTEITIDKHNQVVEKTIRKKKSVKLENTDKDDENCCCLLSCFKNNKDSSSKCCFGCRVGCKTCKSCSSEDVKDCDTTTGSSCCFGSQRKRKNIEKPEQSDENTKKQNKELSCCFNRMLKSSKKADAEYKPENKRRCLSVRKSKTKDGQNMKESIVVECNHCFGNSKGKVEQLISEEMKSESCFAGLRKRKKIDAQPVQSNFHKERTGNKVTEEQINKNDKLTKECFACFKKAKVSTLDEPDIENDVLPDSQRSEDIAQKKSFQVKDNIESKEVLLKKWEDLTGDTTNKKGSTLSPIDLETDEKLDNDKRDNTEVSLKTKSSRVATKTTKGKETSENNDIKKENAQKSRPRMSSAEEILPKPLLTENVHVPVSKRASKVSKVSILTDEDPEEGEVDSLADLEQEVTWPEVGRILDTFFFLVFAGGQAFITVVFLVPLFTHDTKGG